MMTQSSKATVTNFLSRMETKVSISPKGVELAREGSVSGSGVILRLS